MFVVSNIAFKWEQRYTRSGGAMKQWIVFAQTIIGHSAYTTSLSEAGKQLLRFLFVSMIISMIRFGLNTQSFKQEFYLFFTTW